MIPNISSSERYFSGNRGFARKPWKGVGKRMAPTLWVAARPFSTSSRRCRGMVKTHLMILGQGKKPLPRARHYHLAFLREKGGRQFAGTGITPDERGPDGSPALVQGGLNEARRLGGGAVHQHDVGFETRPSQGSYDNAVGLSRRQDRNRALGQGTGLRTGFVRSSPPPG